MNKLIGMKWVKLSKETKADLLEKANCIDGITGNNIEDGECIVDLIDNLSVAGRIEDYEIVIDDNAIIYDPNEGVILEANNDVTFEINEVMTVTEASEKWGITEGAIRAAIKANKFILSVDYRKAGRITLITREAMERVYGKLKER